VRIHPVDESKQIRIEQIRDLGEELSLTSHQGGYKVGVISPADVLNRFAANALLKTLEGAAAADRTHTRSNTAVAAPGYDPEPMPADQDRGSRALSSGCLARRHARQRQLECSARYCR